MFGLKEHLDNSNSSVGNYYGLFNFSIYNLLQSKRTDLVSLINLSFIDESKLSN